jgi:hypothetical protein
MSLCFFCSYDLKEKQTNFFRSLKIENTQKDESRTFIDLKDEMNTLRTLHESERKSWTIKHNLTKVRKS